MKEDEFNYLTLLGTDADKHIRYYITVCARREKDGFKNSKAWFDYLRLWKPNWTARAPSVSDKQKAYGKTETIPRLRHCAFRGIVF